MKTEDLTSGEDVAPDRLSNLLPELLWMVISELTPASLLAISRTSRFFRRLVFTKRAEPIWTNARKRDGWIDLQAGGWNEIEYAKFVSKDACQVCKASARNGLCDFHLRVVLCEYCAKKLVQPGDMLVQLHHQLHPEALDCCLWTERRILNPNDGSVRHKMFYFTPELLLHSAELWRLEALALAHNKPPDDATTVYVEQRELYIDEVFSDVAQLSNNARRLDEAATAEVQRACRLRSEMIDERLLALGFEPSDLAGIHNPGTWCKTCLDGDYSDEVERFKEQFGIYSDDEEDDEDDSDDEDEAMRDTDDADAWYEREQRHAQVKQQMLEHWHSNCAPGEGSLAEDFEYPCELLTDEEWLLNKAPLIEYCEKRRRERLADAGERSGEPSAASRQQTLLPFFQLVEAKFAAAGHVFSITFDTFLHLPGVKPFWRRANGVDLKDWSQAESDIERDVFEAIRRDKIRLFDRITRCLASDGVSLPSAIESMLEQEPSIYVDYEPSNGLAPLHAALTDAEMDSIFSRAVALFRCGRCSTKLGYPAIIEHARKEHNSSDLLPNATLPSEDFRIAFQDLLSQVGAPCDISAAEFASTYASGRFDVLWLTKASEEWLSESQTWAQITAGVSIADRNAFNDREILEITPADDESSDDDFSDDNSSDDDASPSA